MTHCRRAPAGCCWPGQRWAWPGRRTRRRPRTIVDETGQRRTIGYRFVRGGPFVWPIRARVQRLSLELLPADVSVPAAYTAQGVRITVEGVAPVKVRSDDRSIALTAEQFLSRPPPEIWRVAHQVVEGHLQTVLGTVSVEEVYRRREAIARRVREAAEADLAYDLQRYRMAPAVKAEEIPVALVEKERQIALQEQEIERRRRELEATVIKPAEAERQRIELLAQADGYRRRAEADGLRARGLAEARRAVDLAEAWSLSNEAALTAIVVNVLPQLANASSQPLPSSRPSSRR